MAIDDGCFGDEGCRVDPEYSKLLVAPCNTIPWVLNENGEVKPVVTQALIDAMYNLKICGTLEYTPEVDEPESEPKIGGCGLKECLPPKVTGYEFSGPVQYCIGDCWTESLVHPTLPCAFDFIYFLQPENCEAPTVDDLMWVGSATSIPTGFSFDPTLNTGLRPDARFKGCNRPMCILNDCASNGETPTLPGPGAEGPVTLDDVQAQLDMGAEDAIAEKLGDEPQALAA